MNWLVVEMQNVGVVCFDPWYLLCNNNKKIGYCRRGTSLLLMLVDNLWNRITAMS
jgi:hypothetical protein